MIADKRRTLERVHALALAAMASLATPPPPAAGPPAAGLTPLEIAWLKSIGRIPGRLPPADGWDTLAAAAGYVRCPAAPAASAGGTQHAAQRSWGGRGALGRDR